MFPVDFLVRVEHLFRVSSIDIDDQKILPKWFCPNTGVMGIDLAGRIRKIRFEVWMLY